MKYFLSLVTLLVLTATIQAHAYASPYMILCREHNGDFVVYNSDADQIAFCKFGKSLVRAETFANYVWSKKKDIALEQYFSNRDDCNNEQTLWIYNDQGKKVEVTVCVFDKDTIKTGEVTEAYEPMMDKDTVIKTTSSPDNAKLNDVLNQVFP